MGGTGASTVALFAPTGGSAGDPFADQKAVEDTVRKGFTLSRLPDSARTWAQINGLDPEGLQHVSVKGLENDDFGGLATEFVDAVAADALNNGTYKGIPVTFICVGSRCGADEGKLGDDWVIVPDNAVARYNRVSGDTWEQAVYVEYAHWLNDTGNVAVNLYVAQGLGSAAIDASLTSGTGAGTVGTDVASATYSGTAAGMSVRDNNGATAGGLVSGSFTADVNLTATFRHPDTTENVGVRGTVNNFKGEAQNGANANPSWVVGLDNKPFSDTTGGVTTVADGSPGTDGTWRATGYGGNDSPLTRPDGFYGAFDANFSDGQARGVYVTD